MNTNELFTLYAEIYCCLATCTYRRSIVRAARCLDYVILGPFGLTPENIEQMDAQIRVQISKIVNPHLQRVARDFFKEDVAFSRTMDYRQDCLQQVLNYDPYRRYELVPAEPSPTTTSDQNPIADFNSVPTLPVSVEELLCIPDLLPELIQDEAEYLPPFVSSASVSPPGIIDHPPEWWSYLHPEDSPAVMSPPAPLPVDFL